MGIFMLPVGGCTKLGTVFGVIRIILGAGQPHGEWLGSRVELPKQKVQDEHDGSGLDL